MSKDEEGVRKVPVSFDHPPGVTWAAIVSLSADGTKCRGITVDTIWGDQGQWGADLVLPLPSLIETARHALETEEDVERGLMTGIVSEVLLSCGLVQSDPDDPCKWVIAHPRPEDGRPPLGALLPRAPGMHKQPHSRGRAPIDDRFLKEIAAVYRLASRYGLKKHALLLHYLSNRLNPAPTQPTIDRWVRECRDRGLLPPSGRTPAAA